jgi:iron complex transport system ATP-binding protein
VNRLEALSVSVRIAGTPILDGVSLSLQSGEILAVVGPNGAGKTTLLRALSGIIPLAAGSVRVDGSDIHHLTGTQRARCISVVPQEGRLPAAFSVRQTVLLGRTPYLGWLGRPSDVDLRVVDRVLERLNLLNLQERLVGNLSGGERQRVRLARALVQEAPVMLLDEPTTHLDIQHQSELLVQLQQVVQEQALSVVMILHDLNLAGIYADRVLLLVAGQVSAVGTPAEVITTRRLAETYQVPVQVIPHPETGMPIVLPNGSDSL